MYRIIRDNRTHLVGTLICDMCGKDISKIETNINKMSIKCNDQIIFIEVGNNVSLGIACLCNGCEK